MKKVLALLLVFTILIGNLSMVFADGEVLGSITVNYINKDTQEIIEWEILSDLEMGEHIINSREIEGYNLIDMVTKAVYLEEGNENQEANFNYIKNQEKFYDGQAHLKLIDEETGEITYTENFQLIEGETLTIPIQVFIEDKMLEVGDYRLNSDSQTYVEGVKVNISFDYNSFDENYYSNLVVEVPIEVYDFTADFEIEYRKVKPFIRIQQWLDGEMIGQRIEYLDLGTQVIQADEIEGLEVIGENSKEVTLGYSNHKTEIIKFDYTFGLEPEAPEIPSILPNIPESLIEYESIPDSNFIKLKDEIEEVPEIKNLLQGDFISRWLYHEPIVDKPFKVDKRKKIKIDITEEQQNLMKEKDLQPRLYYWHEERERWVALSNIVTENTIETYNEKDGWIAIFGVKQPRFEDVKGDEWFVERMDRANGLAIVEGVKQSDGSITLSPEKMVTRKEFYAMVGRIFGAVPKGQTSLYNELDCIVEGQGLNWYTPYLQEFYNKGIISNVFTKDEVSEEITRLEALELLTTMLSRVEKVDNLDLSKFKDVENPNIQLASIVDGFPDNTLRLDNNLSRIDAITILVNTLERLGW